MVFYSIPLACSCYVNMVTDVSLASRRTVLRQRLQIVMRGNVLTVLTTQCISQMAIFTLQILLSDYQRHSTIQLKSFRFRAFTGFLLMASSRYLPKTSKPQMVLPSLRMRKFYTLRMLIQIGLLGLHLM